MTNQKMPLDLTNAVVDSDAVMAFILDNFEGMEVEYQFFLVSQ